MILIISSLLLYLLISCVDMLTCNYNQWSVLIRQRHNKVKTWWLYWNSNCLLQINVICCCEYSYNTVNDCNSSDRLTRRSKYLINDHYNYSSIVGHLSCHKMSHCYDYMELQYNYFGEVEVITSNVVRSPPWRGQWLRNVCVAIDYGYAQFVIITSWSFPHSWLSPGGLLE